MGLEYIHAALLLHEAKKDITEEAISKIIEAAGMEVDKAMVKSTVENLKNINIDEVLSTPIAPTAPTAVPAQVETKEEKKEEEKKEGEEKKEEEAAAGLSSLFG